MDYTIETNDFKFYFAIKSSINIAFPPISESGKCEVIVKPTTYNLQKFNIRRKKNSSGFFPFCACAIFVCLKVF